MKKTSHKDSVLRTWLVVCFCIGIVLAKGYFAYFWVGDLGMPGWDYRPVKDIPGESAHAVYAPLPYPQHVMGKQGN